MQSLHVLTNCSRASSGKEEATFDQVMKVNTDLISAILNQYSEVGDLFLCDCLLLAKLVLETLLLSHPIDMCVKA